MWLRLEASLNPSVGVSHWFWLDSLEGAPEAVRKEYKKFGYPNTIPPATQSGMWGVPATLTLRRVSGLSCLSAPLEPKPGVRVGRGGRLLLLGCPRWGHISYPRTHPLLGLWVVVWLLILESCTLTHS